MDHLDAFFNTARDLNSRTTADLIATISATFKPWAAPLRTSRTREVAQIVEAVESILDRHDEGNVDVARYGFTYKEGEALLDLGAKCQGIDTISL